MTKGRILTPNERQRFIRTIMTKAPLHEKALMILLCTTGLRSTEIANLKHKNIDQARSCLQNVLTKGGVIRQTIPLPHSTRGLLTQYLHWKMENYLRSDDDACLFLNMNTRRGLNRDFVAALIKRWGIEAGLALPIPTPHDFRRDLASSLSDSGVHPTTIQQVLGHSNVGTTYKYIRSIGADTRGRIQAFENYLFLNAKLNQPIDILSISTTEYVELLKSFILESTQVEFPHTLITKMHTALGAVQQLMDELLSPKEIDEFLYATETTETEERD